MPIEQCHPLTRPGRERRMPVKKIIAAIKPSRAGKSPAGQAASPRPQNSKRINLALQGGGAHGAFTWGVLEHLLSDDRLVIEGVSGTSAGAINAVMLADGLARGGRDGGAKTARRFLARGLQHRQSAAGAARGGGAAVVVHAGRRLAGAGLVRCDVAVFFALRFQSAQHQSAEGSDRAFRRFRKRCVVRRHASCSFRRPMCRPGGCGFSAREDHRRRGHGFGLPADALPARSRSTACPIGTAAISAIR